MLTNITPDTNIASIIEYLGVLATDAHRIAIALDEHCLKPISPQDHAEMKRLANACRDFASTHATYQIKHMHNLPGAHAPDQPEKVSTIPVDAPQDATSGDKTKGRAKQVAPAK